MSWVALFVDDEPRILEGLRRGLRSLRHEADLRFALGGQAGLDALGEDIDVVVTDMRMPHVDGIDVLLAAQHRAPKAARVILSGHSEQKACLRAAGLAHRFLAKPCDATVLLTVLPWLAAVAGRDVSGPGALLSDPDIVGEARLLSDDGSGEQTRVVLQDPALVLKVLQLAGSSFFAPGRPVSSVGQAVGHLGAAVLRDLLNDPGAVRVARTEDERRRVQEAQVLRLAALPPGADDRAATAAALSALGPLLPAGAGAVHRLLALWGVGDGHLVAA